MTKKMVDGEFVSKLVEGSFEEAIRRVDEMIEQNSELFGGDGVSLQSWTFPTHVIVVNSEGEFFRASLGVSEESGEPQFEEVERIEVPVREARSLTKEAREAASSAVEAILSGNRETAIDMVAELHNLVQGGVRLTAEAVEDDLISLNLREWLNTVHDHEKEMRKFVGAEANKSVPQPRFENIQEHTPDNADRFRRIVTSSLLTLKENLTSMVSRLALASEITEAHVLRSDSHGPVLTTEAYLEFVESFAGDLVRIKGVVEDAIAVSSDGDLQSLARVHDGVAGKMYEMSLATAFSEKLARLFDIPAA